MARSPSCTRGWTTSGFGAGSREELEEWERRFDEHGVTYTPIRDMEMGHHLNFRDPDGIALELSASNELLVTAQQLMAAGDVSAADIAAFVAENLGPDLAPRTPARPEHGRRAGRLAGVADRLDVVALGVADEGAVVGRVVLRPQPRLVERLGAGGQRLGVPGPHGRGVGGAEGDVHLAVGPDAVEGADPEVGPLGAVADGDARRP